MNRQDKRQGLRKAVRKAQAVADRIGPVDPDYDHKADMDELAGEGGARIICPVQTAPDS